MKSNHLPCLAGLLWPEPATRT